MDSPIRIRRLRSVWRLYNGKWIHNKFNQGRTKRVKIESGRGRYADHRTALPAAPSLLRMPSPFGRPCEAFPCRRRAQKSNEASESSERIVIKPSIVTAGLQAVGMRAIRVSASCTCMAVPVSQEPKTCGRYVVSMYTKLVPHEREFRRSPLFPCPQRYVRREATSARASRQHQRQRFRYHRTSRTLLSFRCTGGYELWWGTGLPTVWLNVPDTTRIARNKTQIRYLCKLRARNMYCSCC